MSQFRQVMGIRSINHANCPSFTYKLILFKHIAIVSRESLKHSEIQEVFIISQILANRPLGKKSVMQENIYKKRQKNLQENRQQLSSQGNEHLCTS